MSNQIPPNVQNCKSRIDVHLDNKQEPINSKYPICFDCNILRPYCTCDIMYPKAPSKLPFYLILILGSYSAVVTYLLNCQ